MRTKLAVRQARNVPGPEREELRHLSLRKHGCMAYDLTTHGKNPGTHVLTIRDEAGKLLSWALITPYYRRTARYEFQVYTRLSERNKGYATRLYRAAERRYGKMHVVRHDRKSIRFFNKLGAPR